MSEYVDKTELLTTIGEKNGRIPLWLDEILMECKTVEVAPVVHGKWDDSFDGITPVCSVCKRTHHSVIRTPDYCPNCGAKMDGGN